jgi:hypothetical protein
MKTGCATVSTIGQNDFLAMYADIRSLSKSNPEALEHRLWLPYHKYLSTDVKMVKTGERLQSLSRILYWVNH